MPPQLFQFRWEKRIVAVIHLHNARTWRRIFTKTPIRRAVFLLWIPNHPNFRLRRTNGRLQHFPRRFRDVFRFFHDAHINFRQRLHRLDIVAQPFKQKLRTVAPAYIVHAHIVSHFQPRFGCNRRLQLRVKRLLDGILKFPRTQKTQRLNKAPYRRHLGKVKRLARPTPAPRPAKTQRPARQPENPFDFRRQLNLYSHHRPPPPVQSP